MAVSDLPLPRRWAIAAIKSADGIRIRGWTRRAKALSVVSIALTCFGVVMTFSSSVVADAAIGDPFFTFRNQVLYAAIGLALFGLAASIRPRVWGYLSWVLLPMTIALLALTWTGIAIEVNGAARWIELGPVRVQPSELAKIALLLWLAEVLTRKRGAGDVALASRHLLIPAVPIMILVAGLVAKEDLGTAIVVAAIVMAILFVEGLRSGWLLALLGAGGAGALAASASSAYRWQRITTWLDPEAYEYYGGWQLLQSYYALAGGGWLGRGLGSSRGKWLWVPNPETDFIFVIVGEELGLVGAALTVLAFVFLAVLGLQAAQRAATSFGRIAALAITVWIGGQAMFNIATVTGVLPITGVPLPLVSAGGSALVTTLWALGILVAIAREPAPKRVTRLRAARG